MKRLLLALFCALALVPAAFAFSDVSEQHPNALAIEALVDQGVLKGYEDDTFRPDQDVTRAEATKIILLGLGLSVDESSVGSVLLSDVSESDWYYRVVGTAVDLGIVSGYDDGSFRPSQTVNRAEALKIALETAGMELSGTSSDVYEDVLADAWFAEYVNTAKFWNLSPPQTDGLWHPEEAVSRAEMSELVYRVQTVMDSGQIYDETVAWNVEEFPAISASMQVPTGWYFKSEGVAAVWLADSENGQMSLLSPYANGGTLLMTRYANPNSESSSVLFDKIGAQLDVPYELGSVGAYSALTVLRGDGLYWREWYLVLPDNSMVHLVAMRGDGAYQSRLEEVLGLVVSSLEYVPESELEVDVEAVVESLRNGIQVDGQGANLMDELDDWELFETDAIGVGTGPVDYYYSPSADITVKYERSFDVILDLREGQTSSF